MAYSEVRLLQAELRRHFLNSRLQVILSNLDTPREDIRHRLRVKASSSSNNNNNNNNNLHRISLHRADTHRAIILRNHVEMFPIHISSKDSLYKVSGHCRVNGVLAHPINVLSIPADQDNIRHHRNKWVADRVKQGLSLP
jgi:hypothetical protein